MPRAFEPPPHVNLGGPLHMKTGRCRGCGRAIIWARTGDGKMIPLDPRAVVMQVTGYSADPAGEVTELKVGTHRTGLAGHCFVSHFSTCPKAAEFSGRGRANTARETETAAAPDAAADKGR